MKQIISIHIGQAGIQLADSCWDLFCLEHAISPNGVRSNSAPIQQSENPSTFFTQTSPNNFTPRALIIDLSPPIQNQLSIGSHKQLYHPQFIISGKQDAANNFAKGYRSPQTKIIIEAALDKIRNIANNCQDLQGFIITSSMGGGTGSGLGSLLLEKLSSQFEKKTKMNLAVYSYQKLSASKLQPYNTLLASHNLLEHSDISLVFNNEAIYDICKKKLQVESPSYTHINRVIAQFYSTLTSPLRFQTPSSEGLQTFQSSLVPYPRIHFMLSSFAPFISSNMASQESTSIAGQTFSLFDQGNVLAGCDPLKGKYMACKINYRGEIAPKDISCAMSSLKCKQTIKFVDWCPTGLKLGICYKPMKVMTGGDFAELKNSCSMIANTSAINEVFERVNKRFDELFEKKIFWDKFSAEGMEEIDLKEARQNMGALGEDYLYFQNDGEDEDQALQQVIGSQHHDN